MELKNMNDRVLFLDIDGVLNSRVYYKYLYNPENGNSRLDPYCVILVRRLVEEFSLKIVITSTWRNGVENRLRRELQEHGLLDYLHQDGYTPVIRPANRGNEIELWLQNHSEVKDYIIIDDNENLLEHHLKRFVKTSTNLGMVQERYNHARELLLSYDEITNDTNVALEY
jgi:hypothetical protein